MKSVQISENYIINVQKIGESIIFFQNEGDLYQYDSKKFSEIREQFIKEEHIQKPYIEIRSFLKLKGVVSQKQIRKQSHFMLKNSSDCIALIFCEIPILLKLNSFSGYKNVKRTMIFEITDTLANALIRANLILTSPQSLSTNNMEFKDISITPKNSSILIKESDIVELKEYIGDLIWKDSRNSDTKPNISSKNPLNALEGILKIVKNDISELQANEHQRSQTILDILMSIQAAVIIVDSDSYSIIFANQVAADLAKCTPEKLIGSTCNTFFCNSEQSECPIKKLRKAIDREEIVLKRSDGVEFFVLKSVKEIDFQGKQVLLETFIDISDIKKAEIVKSESLKKLRENEQKLLNTMKESEI